MRHFLYLPILLACACGGSNRATKAPSAEPLDTTYTNNPSGPEEQIATPEPAPGPLHTTDLAETCPVDLEHATVSAEPTDTGIALVFVTDMERVAELRAKIHALAEAPADGPASPAGEPLADLSVGRFGLIAVSMAATDAVDGVRLELRPIDVAQLGELRRDVRAKVVAMEAGACEPDQVGSLTAPFSPRGERRP